MLKVLQVCQRDDPAAGGASRVAVELCRALIPFGIESRCLFLYGRPGAFRAELPNDALYLNLQDSRDLLRHASRYHRTIRSFSPHIVHHHDGLTWPLVFDLALGGMIRVAHAHVDAGVRSFGLRTRLANLILSHLPSRLFCISTSTLQTWADSGVPAARMVLVPNGVDTTRFRPCRPGERRSARRDLEVPEMAFVLLFVGRLHSIFKGTDDFLRVLAELPPTCWGLIVGSGEDEIELRSLAEKLGVGNRVRFTGSLADTSGAYRAADIYLMTSHFEPFGLVVLEAMASAVPVVAFACPGGVGEFVTDNTATIVTKREPKLMAENVARIMENPALIEKAANAASRLAIQDYSWDRSAKILAAEYVKLLSERA